MQNYLLENVEELKKLSPDITALVVHKLHRTPYHLGLIHKGNYHSLTVRGHEVRPTDEMLEDLQNKTYNNLLIELNPGPNNISCTAYFEKARLDAGNFVSCLFPIKFFLADYYSNNNLIQSNNLFELMDGLKDNNFIRQVYATRLTPQMENLIVLMRYDDELIRKHIKKLNEMK